MRLGYRPFDALAKLPIAMSEPQARSTLGTCWRTVCAPLPTVVQRLAAVVGVLALAAAPLAAQLRGRGPTSSSGPSTWWFSGGAGAPSISDISDGPTRSVWHFGPDPLWQYRGTLEKSLDEYTTLGVAAAYGKVDLTVTPLVGADTTHAAASPLPASCAVSCAAQTQLWSLMGQFRSGGGSGFHTLFEASGGVTAFRGMHTRDSLSLAIGKPGGAVDLTGTLGAGFGYPITQGMVIAVVQDFGIGFHTKSDLPSGVGRTWRVHTTRASLRFSF